MQGCSFDGVRFRRSRNGSLEDFRSRRRGRGALRSPTPPRVTGCERVATLSRSPGAALAGSLVSDDAGAVLLTAFVSDEAGTALLRFFFPDDAGVGRSAPLHSLGDGVREGFDPLALSRGYSSGKFAFRRYKLFWRFIYGRTGLTGPLA